MKNIKTLFSMLGKLIKILNKKQKRQSILLMGLLIIVSVLEMLGVSIIVPFIMTMLEPETIMQNKYVKYMIDILHLHDYQTIMYLLSVLIILIYVLKNAFILLANYYQCTFRNLLEKDLNVRMLSAFMKREYTFFLKTNSSEIIRGVNNDISNVTTLVDNFSTIFAEGLTCAVIGIFLICLSPFMAISLLLITGCTAVLIVMGFKKKIGECGEQTREAFAEKTQHSYQAVNGIKEITVSQKRQFFIDRYELSALKAANNNTKYLWISKTPNRIVETVFIACLLLVVVFSLGQSESGAAFVTQLGALGIAAVRILPSISTLANNMNSLVFMKPSLDAAYENLMEAKNLEDRLMSVEKEHEGVLSFQNEIACENIAWKYGEDLPNVLEDLSLSIKKGESVAFIGESGAGKSTMADILLGLFRPQKGIVSVDGKDIFDYPLSWSKMIGYVPQTVFLTDDTVRNNIAFGIPEKEIDENKLLTAIHKAQLDKTIEKLENGLDTLVGERGIKLSGGQRQRIAIARALYHDPKILILDEATSALDNETESAVMEAIDALQGKMTMIIIAHRLTTIRNCDKIYEIKDKKAQLCRKEDVL